MCLKYSRLYLEEIWIPNRKSIVYSKYIYYLSFSEWFSARKVWHFSNRLFSLLRNVCIDMSSYKLNNIRRFSAILETFSMKAANVSSEKTEKLLSSPDIPVSSIHMGFVDVNDKCFFSRLFKNSGHSDDLCNINLCNHIFLMLF
jgi:hypothetical protein